MREDHCFVAAIVALLALSAAHASPVVNGRFNQPLSTGWTTGGDVSILPDAGGDPFALFGENTAAGQSSLLQVVMLGPTDNLLAFDYFLQTQGTFSGGALRDAFAVRLLDPNTFQPLLATPTRTDAFYHEVPDPDTLSDSQQIIIFDSSLVTRTLLTANPNRPGWRHVAVDIAALTGQSVLLEFDLLRANNGQSTLAALDNISVPEPTTLLLLAAASCAARRRRRARGGRRHCDDHGRPARRPIRW